MNQSQLRRYRGIILTILLVSLLGFVSFVIYNKTVFHFVGTNPDTSSVATLSPFFDVVFNKPLQSSKIKVSSTAGLIDSYKVEGAKIHILFNQPLSSSNRYNIWVTGIESISGRQLSPLKFVFTPRDIPADQLPEDQQKALQNIQQQYNQVVQNDPLIQLLPFTSGGNEFKIDYSVKYIHQKAQVVVRITYSSPQGKHDALSWIKSIGADPSKYQIEYVSGLVY